MLCFSHGEHPKKQCINHFQKTVTNSALKNKLIHRITLYIKFLTSGGNFIRICNSRSTLFSEIYIDGISFAPDHFVCGFVKGIMIRLSKNMTLCWTQNM